MDFAVFWLVILGPTIIGLGITIWFLPNGNKTSALWVGFGGCLMLLVAMALQIQQSIWKSEPGADASVYEQRPSVVIDYGGYQVASVTREPDGSAKVAVNVRLKNVGGKVATEVAVGIRVVPAGDPPYLLATQRKFCSERVEGRRGRSQGDLLPPGVVITKSPNFTIPAAEIAAFKRTVIIVCIDYTWPGARYHTTSVLSHLKLDGGEFDFSKLPVDPSRISAVWSVDGKTGNDMGRLMD